MEFTPKNRATVQNMPKLPYAVGLLKGEREKSSVNVNQLQKYFLLSVERFE